MTIKRSALLLSTYNAIHSLSPSASASSTSSKCLSARDSRCPKTRQDSGRKAYATVADDGSTTSHSELAWPDPPKGQHLPTPYQIFALRNDAPYSKQRFYELVKLYHPDRSSLSEAPVPTHPCYNLAHSIKLERYRLIVAAHAILSDPAKRSAYDRWGAGWAGRTESGGSAHDVCNRQPHHPGPFSTWSSHPDPSIWANATWEDWERFRARQDPHHPDNHAHQGPLYLQNSYFVSLVILLSLLGSGINLSRADNAGISFLESRDAVHDRASKELRRVRQETGARAKDERIEWFLRNREASLSKTGIEEIREEKVRRILPEQETCMPEELSEGEQT